MTQPSLPLDLPRRQGQTSPCPGPSLAARLSDAELALVLFESGIESSAVWAHATGLLADPAARPDPNCLLCIAGILLGAWPLDHHPSNESDPMTHQPHPDPDEPADVDQALAECRAARSAWDADPATTKRREAYRLARRQLHRVRRHAIDHHTATQPRPARSQRPRHRARRSEPMTTTDTPQLDPTGGAGGYAYLHIEVACDGHRITIHPTDTGWSWTAYNGATQLATGTANRFITATRAAADQLDEPYLAALLGLDQSLNELYDGRLCDWCGYHTDRCLCECRICGAGEHSECLCRGDRP